MSFDLPLRSVDLFEKRFYLMDEFFSKRKTHLLVNLYKKRARAYQWILVDIESKRFGLLNSPLSSKTWIFSKKHNLDMFGCFQMDLSLRIIRFRIEADLSLQTLETVCDLYTGFSQSPRLDVHSNAAGFCLFMLNTMYNRPSRKPERVQLLFFDESGPQPKMIRSALFCQFSSFRGWVDQFVLKRHSLICNWLKIKKYGSLRRVCLTNGKTRPLAACEPYLSSLDMAQKWAVVVSKDKQLGLVNSHSQKRACGGALELLDGNFFMNRYLRTRAKLLKQRVYVIEDSTISKFEIVKGLLQFVSSVKLFKPYLMVKPFAVNIVGKMFLRIKQTPPVDSHFSRVSDRRRTGSGTTKAPGLEESWFECAGTLGAGNQLISHFYDRQSNSVLLLICFGFFQNRNLNSTLDLQFNLGKFEFKSNIHVEASNPSIQSHDQSDATGENDESNNTDDNEIIESSGSSGRSESSESSESSEDSKNSVSINSKEDDPERQEYVFLIVLFDMKAEAVQYYLFKSVFQLTIQTVSDGAIYLDCRSTQSKKWIGESIPNSKFVKTKFRNYAPRTKFKLIGLLSLSPPWEPCPAQIRVNAARIPKLRGNPSNSSLPDAACGY